MPITVSNVLDSTAALVNDPSKVTYTYVKMLPYFRIVYETAQNRLILAGHPTLSEVSIPQNIPAGTTEVLALDTQIARDTVVYPVSVFERAVGDNDDAWDPMERREWDDNREPSDTLGNWAWREGVIKLNAATVDREILVRYRRVFASILNETSQIEHPNFASFLSHATAGYIAMFVMKDITRANALNDLAEKSMDVAISTAVKNLQFLPKRRRRYFFRR